MYENYSNRVKDFITEMTIPEKKIIIDDVTKKVTNARDEMFSEGGLKKPFVFKGYSNETERIKQTIKNNRYLYNMQEYDDLLPKKRKKKVTFKKKINENKSQQLNESENLNVQLLKNNVLLTNEELKNVDYFIKNKIIIQPQMRFKARTDLERVYENLIDNYDKNEEKEVLNRQLKNINLNSFQTAKDLIKIKKHNIYKNQKKNNKKKENDEKQNINKNFLKYGYEIIENNTNKNQTKVVNRKNKNDLYYIPKNLIFKPWAKNRNLNIEAEKMLNSYHIKTHFKAAEEIAENKLNSKENNKKNLNTSNNIFNESDFYDSKERFFVSKNEINNTFNKNIIYENYTKNINPFNKIEKEKKEIEENEYNKNKLNLVSDLAFRKISDGNPRKISEETKIIYNDSEKKKLIDDNSVLIGNEIYYKNSQIDIIANKVLNSCNVYRQKSKHNDTNLKKKNGKLMITKGMTINQFEKKYNLNN
jgi:hypothetical protein